MSDRGILHNIRILDFSWVLAGPYATRILADFGAEVIKVQPLLPEAGNRFSRGYYNTWNRNKLGITLNLDKPAGVALARRLVAISDVVAENFSPRVMANWELDYAGLKKVKPDIIMLSMSLMGQTGPWRNYAGFGPTAQAFSGITGLTAYPGGPPMGLGHAYADHVAALYACIALLGALEFRRVTGEGQHLDISQVEAMASLLAEAVMEETLKGESVAPVGNSSSEAVPYGVYRCRGNDRWCAIAVSSDEEWLGFRQALGNPPWITGACFATLAARLENAAELDSLVEGWTKQHTAEEVMTLLQGQGVAAGVVQSAADLARDPQLKARGFFVELGKTMADTNPIKLTDVPAAYKRVAPLLGQDNDYVYKQLLGISDVELAALREQGIV
ncbi:CaiB/BaiF CoA transferase family protein [Chloroflexota bacterium]